MEHKILIVDDDDEYLASLVSQFKDSQNIFDMITASDGAEAMNILKDTAISLVVSDVVMPVMDGFILMAYISGLYPDIPVIMINEPGEVGAEEAALESGAVAYMEKPFTPMELLHTISDTFKKMSDGGQLANVSLEMFIQLFEMERKTCTIRVQDKSTNRIGTLFLKNGELFNARINEIEGNEAAYEIISWNENSVTISDSCPVEHRLIDGDNQAILLEAARRKDAKIMAGGKNDAEEHDGRWEQVNGWGMEAAAGSAEGGKLANVSLETFLQLFEMEEKTCALTVENPEKNLKGLLYFKKGELLDAKLDDSAGREAALKILSWEKVSVEIGSDVEVAEKRIDGDLQEILLEAMRLRDEGEMTAEDFVEDEFGSPAEHRDEGSGEIDLTDEQEMDFLNMLPESEAEPWIVDIEPPKPSPRPGALKKIWSWVAKK
jgi:CheY-like chemotaxis protein